MFLNSISRKENIPLTDEELLAQFRITESKEIAAKLFGKYVHLLYGVGLKYLQSPERSKDVVMSTYEKMCLYLPHTEVADFSSWIYKVARNECLNILQTENKLREQEENFAQSQNWIETPNQDENTGHSVLVKGEKLDFNEEIIAAAMRRLQPHHRKCVHHFYFDNMSYEQIAKKCKFSVSEVKSYLQNGKRKLKLILLQESRAKIS